MNTKISSRLTALRTLMASSGIEAVIIPQTDPHQSEYVASHWKVRLYFSGFNGSAGTLVVTATQALLWTDSRYFIQAARQLDGTGIILMKEGLDGTPSIEKWLTDSLQAGATVGIDGMVYSATATDRLIGALEPAGINVVIDFDPARVWEDRPSLPQCKVFVHDIRHAGEDVRTKIEGVLCRVEQKRAKAVFISALDEIAWILNIRSNDVRYNPVATAFLYLSGKGSTLFIDPAKLTDEVKTHLSAYGVATAPYDTVLDFVHALPADATVLVEPSASAVALVNALGDRAIVGDSPVAVAKATKNDVQLSGIRAAMARDGVALVRSLMEIQRRADGEGEPLTETGVCEILLRNRKAMPLFFDESFGTIAGYGPHGAIVHYEPTAESDVAVLNGNLLLIDSGAQYLDGTTDITRTICLGSPTPQQRTDFTLVMKGHIALASAVFPTGTSGTQLDVLARQFLWKHGLSYLHGTGHGVGHFLNVHEGPQRITFGSFMQPLVPGMVTSNEPGLYREGVHGIRCENLVLTVKAMDTEFGHFLRFETLTLCPFDLALFDTSLMTADEIAWVNDYHARVRATLTPLLANEAEREWLAAATRPLA
ncbi:MAG: aminopeptidase P family protein [Muribaculaceae bacterium]